MKVNTELEDYARQATWLGFLREARKVTLQSLAVAHATQRSNLSAFVTSKGQTRNISPSKIRAVLFELGVLPDGMLTQGGAPLGDGWANGACNMRSVGVEPVRSMPDF